MIEIDQFIESWRGKSAMSPINIHNIDELEAIINAKLPSAYTYLLNTYGLVRSANVMNSVIDLNAKLGIAHDFLSLEDVSSLSNLYEMSGMAKGYILFASDAAGNMFCFNREDCSVVQEDCAVWFFDSGSYEISKVSDSFTSWLKEFG